MSRLALLAVLFVALPARAWLVRMNRVVEVGDAIYVVSLVEHGPHVGPRGDFLTPRVIGSRVNPYRIATYERIGLVDPRTDAEFIRVLETTEALGVNTSLLFIQRFWREKDVVGVYPERHARLLRGRGLLRSKLVALLGVAKLDATRAEFPTEERLRAQGVVFPRSGATDLPAGIVIEPLWLPGFHAAHAASLRYGDTVVLNSHIAEENLRYLVYVLARSHGLFSVGRETDDATLVPDRFALEAIGPVHRRLYEREGWTVVGRAASPEFGGAPDRDRTTFLMAMTRDHFFGPYALRLGQGAALEVVRRAVWHPPQLVTYASEDRGAIEAMPDPLEGLTLLGCAERIAQLAGEPPAMVPVLKP